MKTKIEIILVLDRIPTFSYYIIQSTISWFPHGDSWTVGLSFCKVVGRVINLIDEPSSYFWAYPYKLQKCHTYSTHKNPSSSCCCCCCNSTFEISFQKQSVLPTIQELDDPVILCRKTIFRISTFSCVEHRNTESCHSNAVNEKRAGHSSNQEGYCVSRHDSKSWLWPTKPNRVRGPHLDSITLSKYISQPKSVGFGPVSISMKKPSFDGFVYFWG